MVLKFPSSIHGRMPEHGQFPLHLQPSPKSSLLVTCNDYIGLLKLGRTSLPQSMAASTHDTQLCCAIYNSKFKQVSLPQSMAASTHDTQLCCAIYNSKFKQARTYILI